MRFTQREASELAQALTSINPATREEKAAIREEVGTFRFDSPFGKHMRRLVSAGIGLHHAGLLPKYRLLVERLAQRGLLKVLVGTDTLGVGINVPIRSVLFSQLCKFDGEKVGVLSVRDFKQIAGRAGRRGFDTSGYVYAQAPEHVIANMRAEAKAAAKGRRVQRRQPPTRPRWCASTRTPSRSFRRARRSPSSRVSRSTTASSSMRCSRRSSRRAPASATSTRSSARRRSAACSNAKDQARVLADALVTAGVVAHDEGADDLRIAGELQSDFSLFQSLSLYLVHALGELDPEHEDHVLHIIGLAEAIQENPTVILLRQEKRLKGEVIQRLKGEGVEYEERMEAIEDITWPKPTPSGSTSRTTASPSITRGSWARTSGPSRSCARCTKAS